MGKSWFTAVKKALSPEAKGKKQDQKPRKVKKWFGKNKKLDTITSNQEDELPHAVPSPKRQPEFAPMAVEDVKLAEVKDEQTRYAYSAALATAVAAEAAVAAAQAAAEVVRLTASSARFPGKPKEEIAAIKIQTVFRGYMARRGLRALRGLVRLKSIIQGQSVRRQATSMLLCMQTLARVQYQIRERRLRLSDDKQAHIKQLQHQKHEKDFEKVGDNWDDSALSKEQIDANTLNKHAAAMRRERALAYSFSHQKTWKNASKFGHLTFMDPSNPHWGWSWLEQWMAARPLDSNDKSSVKSSASHALSEITPRTRNPSPKGHKPIQRRRASGEEDTRSIMSIQSEQPCRHRRHSICGSARDDESITSCSQSQTVPSYMAPTRAAMARARLSSLSPLGSDKAKKRLSFSGSPMAVRRLSGPPKLESNGSK
ncbi:PREDICTED: protein IQ-DOMAIN 1 isoform X2 [Tarenaya hassleriana]|uniref:protein IQ-DOMAIN 1 isoform X1 n=1 Tax=Tarenaya hassleriana TaxID=28532 RepID=UPI00053C5219|nr:PREDICTED: protein IQ-DOMAIN 1 isoform X1 [Tarenaya hassleriana]XP_010553401.1 PREDICTED: protein IQ-DOMAIN 1 isoform X2 [Tarenaya hassleriana]